MGGEGFSSRYGKHFCTSFLLRKLKLNLNYSTRMSLRFFYLFPPAPSGSRPHCTGGGGYFLLGREVNMVLVDNVDIVLEVGEGVIGNYLGFFHFISTIKRLLRDIFRRNKGNVYF